MVVATSNPFATKAAETDPLVPSATTKDSTDQASVRSYTNRNRLISVVSLILAVVCVTLLVSFSSGSKSTVSSSSNVADFTKSTPNLISSDLTSALTSADKKTGNEGSRKTKPLPTTMHSGPVMQNRPTMSPVEEGHPKAEHGPPPPRENRMNDVMGDVTADSRGPNKVLQNLRSNDVALQGQDAPPDDAALHPLDRDEVPL